MSRHDQSLQKWTQVRPIVIYFEDKIVVDNYHLRQEGLMPGVEITGESEGLDPESMFMNYGSQKYEYIEQYMCAETGIKSGTLYYANMLFATEEEAQKLCDKRNNES